MELDTIIEQFTGQSNLKINKDLLISRYSKLFSDKESQVLLQHFLPQTQYKKDLLKHLRLLIEYNCNNPKSFSVAFGDEMVTYEDVPLPINGFIHLVLYYILEKDKGIAMTVYLYGLHTEELVEEYQEFLDAIFQIYKKINSDLWAVNFIIETLSNNTP